MRTPTKSFYNVEDAHVSGNAKSWSVQEPKDSKSVLNGDDDHLALLGENGAIKRIVTSRARHERPAMKPYEDGEPRCRGRASGYVDAEVGAKRQ